MGKILQVAALRNDPGRNDVTESATAPNWRAGKPAEDPSKTKRWGWVTAKPSEVLVHVRRGKVRKRTSGQGASCFKWPWDAVAIVPTSLQRLTFVADQVTMEKVGVEVRGLAVYRIANPLLAFRVLNFSYPERAQEKLEETLTDMFIGGTRRLIANLSVEDCLQKRKSALAEELIREIAPVVGGDGTPRDTTVQGWGVVIDTIEVQEVRVLSENVFAAMQAPYRAALNERARVATAEAEREIAEREAACNRSIEAARIGAELEVSEKKAAAAKRRQELETEAAEHERRMQQREAEASLEAHAVVADAEERERALSRARWEAEQTRRREASELAMLEGRQRAAVETALAEARRVDAEAKARVLTAEKLPELAAAVGERFGEVKITQIGSENPFGNIAQAVAGVMELARGVAGE